MNSTDSPSLFTPCRIEPGIYQRGPFSLQVKLRVGKSWITGTFDTLDDARDYRDLKRIARARDPDFERVVGARAARRAAEGRTLDDMLEKYLKDCTAHKKHPKVEAYRIGVIRRAAIAKLPFFMVDDGNIESFLDSLPIGDGTKIKYVAILRHLYNVARKKWKLKVGNPCLDIVMPETPQPRDRRISKDEYRWVIRALGSKLRRNGELIFLVRLAMATACRQGELVNLDWRNVDFEMKVLVVIAGHAKSGEIRTVPLLPDAIDTLSDLLCGREKPTHGSAFASSQNAMRLSWHRVIQRARKEYLAEQHLLGLTADPEFLRDLHFHDIRHEALSWMVETFPDLRDLEVAELAGHKSLAMTKRYVHLRTVHVGKRMTEQLEAKAATG